MTRYLISNNHPAIIDRDTFNLVQAELARRNNKRKKLDSAVTEQGKYSAKYALTELLVCGSCGGSFRRTSKSAKGKTTYYWRCVSRIEHGKTYCKDSAGVEEQMLHEAICRCLSKMMANSGEVFSLIQSNLSYAVSGNNGRERRRCRSEKEIVSLSYRSGIEKIIAKATFSNPPKKENVHKNQHVLENV